MAVNDLSSDEQLVGDAFSLFVAHVRKKDLFAYARRSRLTLATDSGKVSFLAMKTGTPI